MSLFLRIACIVAITLQLGIAGASPVVLGTTSTNIVATWHDIAAAAFNGQGAAPVTDEELRPLLQADMTTVVLAMYDAASAIDGRYQPYAITPRSPAPRMLPTSRKPRSWAAPAAARAARRIRSMRSSIPKCRQPS